MKFIVVYLLCIISLSADLSFEEDKQKHFSYSVLLGVLGTVVVEPLEVSSEQKILYASCLGLIPGIAKEIYDEYHDGKFDNYDLTYDALGSFTGALSAYYFKNWMIVPQKKVLKISYSLKF